MRWNVDRRVTESEGDRVNERNVVRKMFVLFVGLCTNWKRCVDSIDCIVMGMSSSSTCPSLTYIFSLCFFRSGGMSASYAP